MSSWGELVAAWPSVLLGGGLFGLPGIWWAHKRASRKQTDDVSIAAVDRFQGMIDRQAERITALEAQAESERRACAAEIAEVRQALRAAEAEGRLREGRLMHRAKNAEGDLKALLWLAEFAPERMPEAIARMKAEQREREGQDA
jgi:hypothetical protein